jgi:hypothetical protein
MNTQEPVGTSGTDTTGTSLRLATGGGQPPGGWGPPGGAPPQGPPPDGGGWGPPGGGGPPPGGAPPPDGGWGPPPGGAPPGGAGDWGPPGAQPQQPPKKSKLPIILGVGCLVVLLVVAGVIAVVFYLGRQKLKEFEQTTGQIAAGTEGATAGATGDACAKATACCRALAAKSPNAARAEDCESMKMLGEAACQQALKGYQLSSKMLGINCGTVEGEAEK